MTTEEYDKKISTLENAIKSPATPENTKKEFEALLEKLKAKRDELVPEKQSVEPVVQPVVKKSAGRPRKEKVEAAPLSKKYELDAEERKMFKHWKGMPTKKSIEEYAEFMGNRRRSWNNMEVSLTKKQRKELVTFQKFIHEYYPEFNHYLDPTIDSPKKSVQAPIKKAAQKPTTPVQKVNAVPYDCDELISKERERQKKQKAATAARSAAPKHTPAVKNKIAIEKVAERVTGNVIKRIEKGEVKRHELEKLIKTTESLLQELRAALKKL